ncbi:MAG TPA: hypothetical protein VMG10_12740, partial [Gemmataceae bacterium]|nr:hypothetical protein [Gemmataceae bacterium]
MIVRFSLSVFTWKGPTQQFSPTQAAIAVASTMSSWAFVRQSAWKVSLPAAVIFAVKVESSLSRIGVKG